VVFTVTAPLAFDLITNTITVSATEFDLWPDSNRADLLSQVVHVGGWGDAFADEALICGHYAPCFAGVQDGLNHTDWGSRLTIYPGTYTDTLTLDRDVEIVFTGDVVLNGSLDLSNGTFRARSVCSRSPVISLTQVARSMPTAAR
jgi:hypothetical protein